MDRGKTGLERAILGFAGAVGALTGLATAINGLLGQGTQLFANFSGLKGWQLVAALALFAAGLWLLRLSFRRRSVLLHPEALRLERDNPAHLVGRKEDIAQLARLCRESSLVFLEGASGTGKSALLQAGLRPALTGDPHLLLVYVESLVGSNWEREPRTFLGAALWSALDEEAWLSLELRAPPVPDAVCALINAIPSKLGRNPLLVLDQFDDYQIRHRDRFLLRRTWLKPGKLAEQNGFWHDIRDLLLSNTIHVLVVTRADAVAGLTSVRFIEPEIYHLEGLPSDFVRPLLAELTKERNGEPVIGDPEYGWISLANRLSADLEQAGPILPQQLKIVLAGLGGLPGHLLTVAAYEQAGGTAGLEARFIEDRIAKAARLHGVAEERVRSALLILVDPTTGLKTVERPYAELLSSIDSDAPEKAQAVLDQLAREEVIRRRVDPGTRKSFWFLDHDYLARAVREADRRANRWQWALSEGARTLSDAGESWARWWRSLLPGRTQLVFFWDRIHGRFHYGGHRLYAAKSLSRFIPYLTILILVTGISAYEWQRSNENEVRRLADDILIGLVFHESDIYRGDVESLLRLASSDEPIRQRALMVLLTSRPSVFFQQPEVIIRAIAGVSPRSRARLTASLRSASASYPPDSAQTRAIAIAARLLGRSEAMPSDWWLANIQNTRVPENLLALAEGLGAAPTLIGSHISEVLHPVLFTNLKVVPRDNELKALTAHLSGSQASDAVPSLLAAIKSTTAPYGLRILREALRSIAAKLSGDQAKEAVAPLLTAIKTTKNPYARYALAEGLGTLHAGLSDDQAREVVEALVTAIKTADDPNDLWPLGKGLGALPTKLTDAQAREAVEAFVTAMKNSPDVSVRGALAAGLGAIPAKLTDIQAGEVVDALLTSITNITDFSESWRASWSLRDQIAALTSKLMDSQAKDAVSTFVAAIKRTTDLGALQILGAGLGALPVKLTEGQAKDTIDQYITAIKSATSFLAPEAFGEGLAAVPAQLSDTQAKDVVETFLTALSTPPTTICMGT